MGFNYSHPRWHKLRDLYRKAHPRCVTCGTTKNIHIDHIKEIRDGGNPWDWNNLQSLCASHHNVKGKSKNNPCGESGEPNDKDSHWYK